MPLAITEAITTLAVAEQRFNLQRTEDPDFFPEWQAPGPDLTTSCGTWRFCSSVTTTSDPRGN